MKYSIVTTLGEYVVTEFNLFYVTILLILLHFIVVTMLLHQITIRIDCNSFVKRCNNVKFKYLLLQ